ncbi:hypothetical protein OMAG_002805 [Candidatus Omnitrophus magneticus]|nr:hypothetical protein OMAG_002805 [Candidatus Omnitrophus magneticus]
MFRLLSRLSHIHSRLKTCCPSGNFHLMLLGFGVFPSRYRSYLLLCKHQRYRTYFLSHNWFRLFL